MEESIKELENLVKKSNNLNVPVDKIKLIKLYTKLYSSSKLSYYFPKWSFSFIIVLVILFALKHYNLNKECILMNPNQLALAFRPPESCSFCRNISEVKRISNIAPDDFEEKYAYSAIPIIITDVTKNWTAGEKFSFQFFKTTYLNSRKKTKTFDCQFFPYKSGFQSLFEGLSLSEDRANLTNGEKPWYFGWSNCQSITAEILRRHYSKPYFLPNTSENGAVDWIFMGWGGLGAHMHVDNVKLPSWQAQIKGSKIWVFSPPPECYFVCNTFDVVVKEGETIVLDTNKWYHQTIVVPGEISITIGAEYD